MTMPDHIAIHIKKQPARIKWHIELFIAKKETKNKKPIETPKKPYPLIYRK